MFAEIRQPRGQKASYGLGLEDKGQKVSKQDVNVEQKVSVALLASRDDNCLRGGSQDETVADIQEGESERRLHLKMMWRGMYCVRNHVEVKSEEEVIRGVQWSNQHMIRGAVSR